MRRIARLLALGVARLDGAVDELNAALGMARATAEHELVRENLLRIQNELVFQIEFVDHKRVSASVP